jgi:hypothetical protein
MADIQERLLVSDLPTLARDVMASNGPDMQNPGSYMVMAAFAQKDPEKA